MSAARKFAGNDASPIHFRLPHQAGRINGCCRGHRVGRRGHFTHLPHRAARHQPDQTPGPRNRAPRWRNGHPAPTERFPQLHRHRLSNEAAGGFRRMPCGIRPTRHRPGRSITEVRHAYVFPCPSLPRLLKAATARTEGCHTSANPSHLACTPWNEGIARRRAPARARSCREPLAHARSNAAQHAAHIFNFKKERVRQAGKNQRPCQRCGHAASRCIRAMNRDFRAARTPGCTIKLGSSATPRPTLASCHT